MVDTVDWSDCIIDGRYRVQKQIGAGSFGALQNLFAMDQCPYATQAKYMQATTSILENRWQ